MSGSKLTKDFGKTVVERLSSDAPTRSIFEKFKIGIGTTTASETDTDLVHAIPISGTEAVDSCDVADWTDSADMTTTLNSTTFKEGVGSLNLTKDAGASADANTYKTTTSRDFTSKELSIWIYIIDAAALAKLATSDCLTIRFGSDNSNYYYWTKDAADLAVGWNLIDGLTSATATETGSPVIAACDYTLVQLTATGAAIVWTEGDFIMDDIKVISADDYLTAEVSTYPTVSTTTLEETHRVYISSTSANGYLLTEMGVFNTDGTPLLSIRGTFSSLSKSNTDELIIVVKNKLRINTLS